MTDLFSRPLGKHENVSDTEYHGATRLGVVSKSALDVLDRSPAHYRTWLEEPQRDTPDLIFGRAFHCALLEPGRFGSAYAAEPDFGDCRKTANREARDAWRAAHASATPIDSDVADAVGQMVRSVREHPLAGKLLSGGVPELTITWKDNLSGLLCKTRPDYYVPSRRLCVDVKSARDASADGFRKAIVDRRYHVQDALYRDAFAAIGEPVEHFVFVVVEKTPPFAVAVYTLDEDGIARGYSAARRGIQTLSECMTRDEWPGYRNAIQKIELPPWAA